MRLEVNRIAQAALALLTAGVLVLASAMWMHSNRTERLTIAGPTLSAAVSGRPVKVKVTGALSGSGTLSATASVVRETDQRMCKQLGVDTATGVAAMDKLWGRLFSAERDRRAGPDANAQRRGIVARQLKAELQEALTDGND